MFFLHDPTSQFIINVVATLLVGIAAVVTTIIIYQKQQSRKGIAYEVISDTPVLSVKKEIEGRVKVLLDNKPVNDLHLMVLRIWNSGNQPIKSEDYDGNNPIRLDFGEHSEILDTEVLETFPNNLKARVTLQSKSGVLTLNPLLLNSRDSIMFKVLLTQPNKDISVDARISGIDDIMNWNNASFIGNRRNYMLSIFFYALVFVVSSIFFLSNLPFSIFSPVIIPMNNVLLIMLFSFFDGIFGFLFFYNLILFIRSRKIKL